MPEQTPPERPKPAPLTQFLTYKLARVQAKLSAQASRILRADVDITLTQWRLIALIGGAESTTATQLSRLAAMDKGLISRNVKSMVAGGLLVSRRDEVDSRAYHLSLTAKGEQIFHKMLPRMEARQSRLRAYLEEDEIAALFRILDKLEAGAEDLSV